MSRKDAILSMRQILIKRRDALRKALAGDLSLLKELRAQTSGDMVDAALDSVQDEISSQLAEVESRELTRIEYALERMREGQFGVCEGCGTGIPMARLERAALRHVLHQVPARDGTPGRRIERATSTGAGCWIRRAAMTPTSRSTTSSWTCRDVGFGPTTWKPWASGMPGPLFIQAASRLAVNRRDAPSAHSRWSGAVPVLVAVCLLLLAVGNGRSAAAEPPRRCRSERRAVRAVQLAEDVQAQSPGVAALPAAILQPGAAAVPSSVPSCSAICGGMPRSSRPNRQP